MKYLAIALVAFFVLLGNSCSADEIRGKIESIDVRNQTITISGITVITQNGRIENEVGQLLLVSMLSLGDFVEVEGYFNNPGVIDAIRVSKDYPKYDQVRGRIATIDQANKRFMIKGITVIVPKEAEVEDEDDISMTFDRLSPRAYVDCRGKWTGPMELTAKTIDKQ